MSSAAPNQFSAPSAAIRATRKAKAELVETFDYGVRGPFTLKQLEDGSNGALHFFIRVENNLVTFKHITNRQRESQLTFACLIELTAMEARTNDV